MIVNNFLVLLQFHFCETSVSYNKAFCVLGYSVILPFHTFPFHCSLFTVHRSLFSELKVSYFAACSQKESQKPDTCVQNKKESTRLYAFFEVFLVNITNKIICIHYASSMSLLFVILRSLKYTFIIHRWFKYFIRYPFFSIYDETGSVLNRIDLDVSSASFNNHQK